jgi:hypothetical protein
MLGVAGGKHIRASRVPVDHAPLAFICPGIKHPGPRYSLFRLRTDPQTILFTVGFTWSERPRDKRERGRPRCSTVPVQNCVIYFLMGMEQGSLYIPIYIVYM